MTSEFIRPGFGLSFLHLGQYVSELTQKFHTPTRRRRSSALRTYWVWENVHFECIVSNKTDRVLSIFLHRGFEMLHPVLLQNGMAFGATLKNVEHAFGQPAKQGGGVTLDDGCFLGRWLSYSSGVGFSFDTDETIETISIFRASVSRHRNLADFSRRTSEAVLPRMIAHPAQ